MLYLNALMLEGLQAVVLVFLARNVRLTWKFSIALFAFMLAQDLLRIWLIIYLMKGFKASEEQYENASESGRLMPVEWDERVKKAVLIALDEHDKAVARQ